MEKVPQIVSERLKAAAVTVEHPDADVLTAFSESSLRQDERATILDHLAKCAECREVVALALPATEPQQLVVRPVTRGWLTWPVLRWGLVAAGIVIVGTFGVVQIQRQHVASYVANNSRAGAIEKESKPLPAVPRTQQQPAENRDKVPAAASALGQPASSPQEFPTLPEVADSSGRNVPGSAPGSHLGSSGTAIGGPVQRGPRVQWQSNTNQQAANNVQLTMPAPAAPPAVAKQMPSAGAARVASPQPVAGNAQSDGTTASVDTPVLESQNIDQQPSNGGSAESKVEKAKPAGTALISPKKVIAREMEPPSVAAGARISGQLASTSPTSPVRWTINTAGGLQRSFDQGSTWQDVDVSSSAPPAAAAMALKKASKAEETNYGSLSKKDKDATTPIVFRAVAANGLEVWAGASTGLLYHSPDAGAHWIRVVPSASGVSLTGDIVSLEFVDPQHGRVTTSTPEVWTTSDSGQSWAKQ